MSVQTYTVCPYRQVCLFPLNYALNYNFIKTDKNIIFLKSLFAIYSPSQKFLAKEPSTERGGGLLFLWSNDMPLN